MSSYTQSGMRKSNRIAGKSPSPSPLQTPSNDNIANTPHTDTFSPFNDSQATNDGVSYSSSSSGIDTKSIPSQGTPTLLQQPSQPFFIPSADTPKSSTPTFLRGTQNHSNPTVLANATADNTYQYKPPAVDYYPQQPPQNVLSMSATKMQHPPATHHQQPTFVQPPAAYNQQLQHQPTATTSTLFQPQPFQPGSSFPPLSVNFPPQQQWKRQPLPNMMQQQPQIINQSSGFSSSAPPPPSMHPALQP